MKTQKGEVQINVSNKHKSKNPQDSTWKQNTETNKRSNHGQVDFISEIKKTPRIDKDLQWNCSIRKAFLYSAGKLNEKEIRETVSFIIDEKILF